MKSSIMNSMVNTIAFDIQMKKLEKKTLTETSKCLHKLGGYDTCQLPYVE